MSRLPSIYEHAELNVPLNSIPPPERIQNNLLDIELGSATHPVSNAAGTPPHLEHASLAGAYSRSSGMTYGSDVDGSSDNPHPHPNQGHSESSFTHSPLLQAPFPSPLVSQPYSPADPIHHQGQPAASGSQTRPTPAANFSALFPAPQPVSSVTTTYSKPQSQSVAARPSSSSSTSKSAPSPLSTARYKPYARPPDNPGHYNYNSSTSGSPAPPSLSSSLSSASVTGSRPSSRSFSATSFTSPEVPATSSTYTPGSSTSALSLGQATSWQTIQGSDLNTQVSDPRFQRSTSSGPGFQPLARLGGLARRQSSSYDPQSSISTGTSSRYYQEDGTAADLRLVEEQNDLNDSFSNYVRKTGQYGYHLQTLPDPDTSGHTPVSDHLPSNPSFLGGQEGATAPYLDRESFEASLPLSAGTRNLLNPFPSSQHPAAPDNRRSSSIGNLRNHQLWNFAPEKSQSATMSNGLYHTDMDMDHMDPYDDDDLLSALPQDQVSAYGDLSDYGGILHQQGSKKDSKQVRRRSSKACDQCRKSKCKCERSADEEACKSCLMLGTSCTFLGPSRKRGPPKGYIDAIESRLHQTEALVGILLSMANPEKGPLDVEDPKPDERARSLLQDLRDNDPLAREIVERVDRGAYGTKGRKANAQAKDPKSKARSPSKTSGDERDTAGPAKDGIMGAPPASVQGRGRMVGLGQEMENSTLATAHPSNEWQDAMVERMRAMTNKRDHNEPKSDTERETRRRRMRGTSPVHNTEAEKVTEIIQPADLADPSPTARYRNPIASPATSFGQVDGREVEHVEGEERIADGVGQLSINEEAQVRFHGKASGLHLLGQKQRLDGRNRGGIWHFPKARVWPPVAPTSAIYVQREQEAASRERSARARLPSREIQEHLLELYFCHVHPFLPVVHKDSFMRSFKRMHDERSREKGEGSSASTQDGGTSIEATGSSSENNGQDVPTILLLAMFSIAARYAPLAHGTPSPFGTSAEVQAESSPNPALNESDNAHVDGIKKSPTSMEVDLDNTLPQPQSGHMWTAGDGFLERAKDLLDRAYSSSLPTTCQALLLMAYREIGIGAMAQSWLYTGIAVRMAQDLGMHRSSETWTCGEEPLFSPIQQQLRKRIWYSCVIMDKYVSTYIGRPLSIFEADYDTRLPSDDELEEVELWAPHPSMPNSLLGDESDIASYPVPHYEPTPGRVLSCFNESARLSSILARIIQAIYVVTPSASRHSELSHLEEVLDMWYMELPPPLQYNANAKSVGPPPPNVLTLHMQYWCTVILLHRPFIPHYFALCRKAAEEPGSPVDSNAYSAAQKNFNLCVAAANHITAIVTVFQERFCLKRCPVFLSYYIFTAGIMHMTTMAAMPKDPQAPLGLSKCMEVLKRMELVWPSAARAWELLHGAKDDLPDYNLPASSHDQRMNKRSSEGTSISTSAQVSDMRTSSFTAHSPYETRFPDLNVATGSSQSLSVYNSYERMPLDGSLGLPVGLSTSVLPQQYSTGLVDERDVIGSHRSHAAMDDAHGRYSQYWSDYSMGHPSSMLGSIYDLSVIAQGGPGPASTHHERHPSHPHHTDYHNAAGAVYNIGNQYNVYPGGHISP